MDCKGKHFPDASQYLAPNLNLHFVSNYQPESKCFCFAYRLKQKRPPISLIDGRTVHAPMQLVAPSAVRIAVAMLAIICAINLMVSFLLSEV